MILPKHRVFLKFHLFHVHVMFKDKLFSSILQTHIVLTCFQLAFNSQFTPHYYNIVQSKGDDNKENHQLETNAVTVRFMNREIFLSVTLYSRTISECAARSRTYKTWLLLQMQAFGIWHSILNFPAGVFFLTI